MDKVIKVSVIGTGLIWAALAGGGFQQWLDNRDRQACDRISSSTDYWKYRCKDRDEFYQLKTPQEKEDIESGELKIKYRWEDKL